MAISENDPATLINDEAGGVAGTGSLGVEGTACRSPEDDDGRNHFVESLPPILSGGHVFTEGRINIHAELVLDGGFETRGLRPQPL